VHREQFVQQIVRTIFSPWYLGAAAAFVGLSLVSGRFSLRILRRMPEFARKRDLVWGAKWCWTLLLAAFVCAYLIAYVGITRTDYLTTATAAAAGFLWLILPALQLSLPRQFYGEMLWMAALASRIRRRPLDIEAWLAKTDRYWARTWLNCGAAFAYLALVLLMIAYIVLAFTYPFDAEMAAQFRAQKIGDEIGLAVRSTIAGVRIQKVDAAAPLSEPDWADHAGEWKMVAWSLDSILGRGKAPPSLATPALFRLFIRVTADTTEREARDMLAQVEKLLADRHEPHRWRIAVYSRESKLSVHGLYPPTEGGG